MWERAFSIFERLWVLFRPKTHNVIARFVIVAGVILATEAQFSFFELIVVFIIESIFGPSELLRRIFEGDSTPWIGVALIAIGSVYHLAITLGLEYFGTAKASGQKEPDLELTIQNLDGETLGQSSTLRGKLCDVPQKKDIPDFSPSEKRRQFGMPRISGMFDHDTPNRDFYRERAALLRKWGGAEVLSLTLDNIGDILGRNVTVKVTASREKGLQISNKNRPEPPLLARYKSRWRSMDDLMLHRPDPYDIVSFDNSEFFVFEWDVGDLQAKASKTSRTSLFIQSRHEIVLEFSVFSDELSSPKKFEFVIKPPPETVDIDVADITAENKQFGELENAVIMDGYLARRVDRMIEEMKDD